jgi:hypothetical protein
MKTVIVKIGDAPPPQVGDVFIVSVASLRGGGQSNSRFDVPEEHDSIQVVNGKKIVVSSKTAVADVVAGLMRQTEKYGPGYQAHRRSDDTYMIMCSDGCDQVRVLSYASAGQKIEIEEIG